MHIGKKRWFLNRNLVLFLAPVAVALGKVLRYTILPLLLANDIGKGFLPRIVDGQMPSLHFWSDGSNNNTVLFFKLVNFLSLNTLGEFEIAVTLVGTIIVLLLLLHSKKCWSLFQAVLTLSMIGILGVDCFALQKEPIQMLFFLAIYFVILSPRLPERSKDILIVLITFISAAAFRTYYILIVGYYIAIRVSIAVLQRGAKKFSKKKLVLLCLGMALIYYFVLIMARRFSPSSYGTLMYALSTERDGTGVNTYKRPLFSTDDPALYPLLYLSNLVRLLFPLELVPMGGKYLLYVIYQLMLTYALLTSLRKLKQNHPDKNLALYYCLAFMFTSGAAEMDFGSWYRHETALFPIYLIMLGVMPFRKLQPRSDKNSIRADNAAEAPGPEPEDGVSGTSIRTGPV